MFKTLSFRRLGIILVAASILLVTLAADAGASHLRGTSISWAPTGTLGQVKFTIKYSERGGTRAIGSGFSIAFNFGDGSSGTATGTVTSVNAAEDWFFAELTVTHTYAGNGPYIAFYNNCCRISTLKVGHDQTLQMQTTVWPRSGNTSPVASMPPVITVPIKPLTGFVVVASDLDRDTLRYRLATTNEMFAYSGVPFDPQRNQPTGLSINATTGQVAWDTTAIPSTLGGTPDAGDLWAAQFIVEDLDGSGAVKSSVPIDVILKFVTATGQAPTLTFNPTGPLSIQAGTPVTFTVTGNDVDAGSRVTLNATGVPSGAMASNLNNSLTPPVVSTFTWTPTAAQGGAYVVNYTATDDTFQQTLGSISIFVENNQPPTITGPATLTTPFTPQAPIVVQVADPNGDALTVTWELDNVVVLTNSVPASPSATTLTFTGYGGVGPHTVKATVKDTKNATATLTTAVTVTKADQAINFGALASKTYNDPDFSVSATATSGLAVTFSATGSCTVTSSTVHITGAGSCTVQASQAGDGNYNAAPNVDQSFTIAKQDQTITFGGLADKTYGDGDFTVSASASSGLSVSFSGTGSCTVSGGLVHITSAGNCTVQASQAGDGNYNPAPSVDQPFTIAKANQTITFGALAGKTFGDANFAVTATASSGLTVSFSATGSCAVTGTSVQITGAGSCTVQASQAGDGNYNPAPSVDQPFAIAKANQTITFGALAGKTFGDANFEVTATASSGLAVSFSATGSCAVSGTSVQITGAGSCTVQASQAGDGNYNPAPSVDQPFTIAKANQTITFGALAGKTFGDANFAVAATASSGLAVSFSATGSCTVTGASVHITGAGNCTVQASQPGNDNYNAAPSVEQPFTIAKQDQTITFAALAGKTFGDADFAVAATASSGLAVSFSATGSCTVTGVSVHITGAGNCTVQASQLGDGNYNPAAQVDRGFAIAKANQVITVVTAAPSAAVYNTSFPVAATGGGSGNPVVITASGVCIVNSGGAGSATVQMNAGTGSCSLAYNQAGDGNYNAAPQIGSATTAQKAAQVLTITTSAPSSAVFGSSFVVAASGGGSGNPILYTTGVDGCTDVGPTFTVTSGVTACVVLYNQAGNANYSAAVQLTQTVSVVGFGFEGFFAPIDVPAPNFMIWNSAKAGQTIPVKWRLTLNGVPVSSLSSFAGLYSYQVSCTSGSGDVEDAIEEYATGGSVLTYDGDGRFHYNWATPLSYKNTCRAMYVKFSDGSVSMVANFKFK